MVRVWSFNKKKQGEVNVGILHYAAPLDEQFKVSWLILLGHFHECVYSISSMQEGRRNGHMLNSVNGLCCWNKLRMFWSFWGFCCINRSWGNELVYLIILRKFHEIWLIYPPPGKTGWSNTRIQTHTQQQQYVRSVKLGRSNNRQVCWPCINEIGNHVSYFLSRQAIKVLTAESGYLDSGWVISPTCSMNSEWYIGDQSELSFQRQPGYVHVEHLLG